MPILRIIAFLVCSLLTNNLVIAQENSKSDSLQIIVSYGMSPLYVVVSNDYENAILIEEIIGFDTLKVPMEFGSVRFVYKEANTYELNESSALKSINPFSPDPSYSVNVTPSRSRLMNSEFLLINNGKPNITVEVEAGSEAHIADRKLSSGYHSFYLPLQTYSVNVIDTLSNKKMRYKLKADLIPQRKIAKLSTRPSRTTVLSTMFVPGLAQNHFGRKEKGLLYSGFFAISGTYAVVAYTSYKSKFDNYKKLRRSYELASGFQRATDRGDEMDMAYHSVKNQQRTSRVSISIALGVYILNIMDVIIEAKSVRWYVSTDSRGAGIIWRF